MTTAYDTEIRYDRTTKDFSCYVTIDGAREYIGSAPNYADGETKCRAYAYDHYADRDTPETAAQILMDDPDPFGPPTIDEEPGPSIEPAPGRTLVPAVRTTARQWLAEDWRRDAEARAWSAGLLGK